MLRKAHATPCPHRASGSVEFCGGCYENRRGRSFHRGHRYESYVRPSSPFLKGTKMKRPASQAALKKGEWSCPDKTWMKEYPNLCAGLCDPWWDDGKPRELWSITLRFEGDSVHACVNDKGGNQGLYTTGEDVDDVLALVEAALAGGLASWRRWRK